MLYIAELHYVRNERAYYTDSVFPQLLYSKNCIDKKTKTQTYNCSYDIYMNKQHHVFAKNWKRWNISNLCNFFNPFKYVPNVNA